MKFQITWRMGALLLVLVACAGYLAWTWYAPGDPIPTESYAEARASKTVSPLPTIEVPVKSVRVIPKAQAVRKLDLPESVERDERKQVLTAVDVPPSEAGAVAVTLLDTETGVSNTLVKGKRRPFLSLEDGNELGIRYGLSTDGGREGELYYRRDLLRVGSVYVGAFGSLDTDAEARAMISISARW